VIDLHSHVLPGVDDGVATVDEAVELAAAAAADGVRILAATPHVRDDFPTSAAEIERGVAALAAELAARGVAIELVSGGEVAYERLAALEPDELRRLTYGGRGAYLLVELPDSAWPLGLEETLFRLRLAGVGAVLAHVERNVAIRASPDRLRPLVAAGTAVQVTAAALDGRLGQKRRAAALDLVRSGVVHVVASDAHHPEVREVGLSAAIAAIGDPGLGRYLVEEAPAAILAGERVPPAPERPARTRGLGRLFRR
jgi:protein-tyrosine phosphatase